MLYACSELGEEAFGGEDTDDGAEGQDFNQEFGFVGKVVVNGANPGLAFFVVAGVFFVVGEVQHTAFEGVAFAADLDNNRGFGGIGETEAAGGLGSGDGGSRCRGEGDGAAGFDAAEV